MTTTTDIDARLVAMTDAEPMAATRTAIDDLKTASQDEPNSEWHEACFAGAIVYSTELQKRGLSLATKH